MAYDYDIETDTCDGVDLNLSIAGYRRTKYSHPVSGDAITTRLNGAYTVMQVSDSTLWQKAATETKHPLLQALVNSGDVTFMGTDLVGHASDGVIVSLGNESNLDAIERYLTDYPTPADW